MKQARYIAAIDQGTTSTRFIVFDRAGRVVANAQKEHAQIYPRPGWVEHDPEEIWQRTQQVIYEAMIKSELHASELAAIGITNQRETAVLWDRKTGHPVGKAIVWQDTRVADDVANFARAPGEDFFRSRTGLPLSTYFSGLKIRWMLDNIPGVRQRVDAGEVLFGNIDAFLLWRLTGGPNGGVHATDVTNASRTQLMNLQTLSWDQDLLKTLSVPKHILPRICSSSEVYGHVAQGVLQGTAVAGILGDQQAALVGQTCFANGETKNTYGTGCFLLMNTGERPVHSKHHRAAGRQKRGGGTEIVSLDLIEAEGRYHAEPAGAEPARQFEWVWATAVLEGAVRRVEAEYHSNGRSAIFAALRPFLPSNAGELPDQAELAASLGLTHGTLRQALFRLRDRFRVTLRSQIADTLQDPTDAAIDEEIRTLRAVLAA